MNRAELRTVRKIASRPPARTVEVTIEDGAFEGWHVEARADFPARLLVEMQSGQIDRVLAALEVIVIDHNLPNGEGEQAEHLEDVDPYDGLMLIAGEVMERITKLPNR